MTISYNNKLRQEARLSFEKKLAEIPNQIALRDKLNGIGKEWERQGKAGRTFSLDWSEPFWLLLKIDVLTSIEFDVNFFVEQVCEQFPEMVDEASIENDRITFSFKKGWVTKFIMSFIIVKKGQCQIVTEKIVKMVENINYKFTVVCD